MKSIAYLGPTIICMVIFGGMNVWGALIAVASIPKSFRAVASITAPCPELVASDAWIVFGCILINGNAA